MKFMDNMIKCKNIIWASVIGMVILIVSCTSLPFPVANDQKKAMSTWPKIKLEDLRMGRELYVLKCSGCHNLYLPGQFSKSEWKKIVTSMMKKAKLTLKEMDLILKYLVTMSETDILKK
ncbi:hypothetical protein ACFL20_08720 [Spirochaetota bacterium]